MSATTEAKKPKEPKPLPEWTGGGLASAEMVAARLAIPRATFFEHKASGRFGPKAHKLGKVTRYQQEEVDAWVKADMPRSELWATIWGNIQKAGPAKKGRGR